MKDRKKFFLILGCTTLVSLFLLACIHQKLAADFGAGKWQSLFTRVGLIGLAGFFLVWRLKLPMPASAVSTLNRCKNIAVSGLFLAVLFYPLFSQLSYLTRSVKEVTHNLVSEKNTGTEKLLALMKGFPRAYEGYTAEKFTLPKSFIHLNALVKVYLLGISPNNNIAVGKEGFYFEGWGARRVEKGITENFDNIADYMGQIPFSDEELRQWKRTLEERKYWLKEQGVEYVFVLAPTKALVYPEYLPSTLQNVAKGVTRYDQLSRFLRREADIHFIDVRPPLLRAKAKRSYPLLFYKTDFHWNFYGAFVVYQAIMDELREKFPHYGLVHPEFSEFDLAVDEHWAHHRFMDMVGLPAALHKNEHYITMVPKPGGRYDTARDLPPGGISDVYPPERPVAGPDGRTMDLRLVLNPEAPVRSLLLLGDSFLEKCVYFFSADARRVLNYRTIVNFPDKILAHEKPDIVIQEVLNMFILRPPPQNPPGVGAGYLKAKFSDSVGQMMARAGGDDFSTIFVDGRRVFELVLPKFPARGAAEVRVARATLIADRQDRLTVRLFTAEERLAGTFNLEVSAGSNDIYFEFPAEPIKKVVLSGAGTSEPAFSPVTFELRSDHVVEAAP